MRLRVILVSGFAMFGCGDDSESAQDRLQGSWAAEDTGDEFCAYNIEFDGSDIEVAYGCELEDESLGIEMQRGTFKVNGDEIEWTATAASCEGVTAGPETLQFEFVGEKLRIMSPDGVLLMERNKGTSGTGGAEFGCFDEEGFFEPRSVQSL